MGLVLPPIEAYQVPHLPIVKAYAAKMGVVEVMHPVMPTEMDVEPGTIILGMLLDTLSGRRPLYRLEAFMAQPDTALLLGKAVPAEAFNDDTVGRVLDRLQDTGTMQVCTACAVRADRVFGFDKRSVHFATTSVPVYGAYLPPEESKEQPRPLRITYGQSKDTRPDLKQCVCSTWCVDRAVPLWGTPPEGHAAETTVQNTRWSDIATCLAKHGVAPGASISVADAALVTEDNRAALGDTLCSRRFPATSKACGRLIAAAVAHNTWAEVGVLAHTQPTQHRPAPSQKAYAGEVPRSGTPQRAVVLHSSAQDKRRQQRLAREIQASQSTMQTSAHTAEQQAYCGRAEAAAAAAQLRTVPTAYHLREVTVEERPLQSRGRPSSTTPRAVKAMRQRLKTTVGTQTARMARLQEEAGCFVLRTKVSTAGDMAHSARDLLTVTKEQHGTEQNDGFLQDPVMVTSLFLKKPERIEALGRIFWLAL